MTVQDLIDKLSKINPDIECFTLDDNAQWCAIIDVWGESGDARDFAYFEIKSLDQAELN